MRTLKKLLSFGALLALLGAAAPAFAEPVIDQRPQTVDWRFVAPKIRQKTQVDRIRDIFWFVQGLAKSPAFWNLPWL